jgi:hypothetical protein
MDRLVLFRCRQSDGDRLRGFCADDTKHKIDYNSPCPQQGDFTAAEVRYMMMVLAMHGDE